MPWNLVCRNQFVWCMSCSTRRLKHGQRKRALLFFLLGRVVLVILWMKTCRLDIKVPSLQLSMTTSKKLCVTNTVGRKLLNFM